MRYRAVRQRSLALCAPLTVEDHVVQSMPDASPAKWHLAHTTWFFETFVLGALGQPPLDERYAYLFNSYYETIGPRGERDRRGLSSRPSLDEVHAYRAAVDERMAAVLEATPDPGLDVVLELGLQHEQQHQELLLTDIKHALGTQPLRPAYRPELSREAAGAGGSLAWLAFDGGVHEIGAAERDFSFDHERPRHRVLIEPFALASRPVCNAEVLAFIDDGGYRDPRLWLADGFALAQREGWSAPLYWELRDGMWAHYDLAGVHPIDPAATACHLSYYEADAIARWARARLPTEAEWEVAAQSADPRDGHWADADHLHPRPARGDGLLQLFGDVWEWTQTAYAPYPGFTPLPGSLGEYNGKFMSGQMILRGGSCFSPCGHVRASSRNFFAPRARWQMAGVRLARDRGAP